MLVRCPICHNVRRASASLTGRRVRCADCHNFFEVTPFAHESYAETDGDAQARSDMRGHLEDDLPDEAVEDDRAADAESFGGRQRDPGSHGKEPIMNSAEQPDEDMRDRWRSHPEATEGDASSPASPNPEDSADEPAGSKRAISRWKEEPDDSDLDESPPDEVALGHGRDRDPIEMDMTPMVDVTFLLLIFFMVTASFTLLKSIEQPPPSSEEPSLTISEIEDNPDYVLVFIDEFNTFTVIYQDLEAEAPSEQELYVRLREAINSSRGQPPSKLLIKAHGDASHERVVMAMDAGTDVGLTEIDVAKTEQDAL